ncbi:Pls/PosA family non-ribosomal peptide synthetase [Acinetobacter guerrae]|uniref:Pls/PosA family non-ribosomal peptide synthetase n=1 Tax=Acinetobacter guerrae TaxID=1843371 RepID=UPI00125FCE8E|nr:Pls/PosA family non-ribosomal peptide synthetase [Acinetobacter guerrae]
MNAIIHATSVIRGDQRPEFILTEVLSDILDHTANQYPTHIALIDQDRQISYAQLQQQVDQIAQQLIQRGVKAGDRVGLWLPRGADLLIAQAGICKAGAAWLPFDMDVPVDRIQICLDDAQAVGIVTSQDWATLLNQLEQTIWTSDELNQPSKQPIIQQRAAQDDAAYIIYTSGSTGKPKGIVIEQRNICHFLRSENSVLGVGHEDKVYQGFSVAFDMSFEEIWISYLVGATIWIAPKDLVTDPERLCKTLQQENITVLHAVPTLLALFPEDVPNLRIINLGGEMCPEALVARWDLPHHQIFNTYGPTETTVTSSLARVYANEPVTIGVPLPNYGMLVLNDQLELLAQGEVGELCVFGPSVGREYLGRPELTAEKFIDNRWAQNEHELKLYRTGDLARLDENGQIQCLGRADDQVKIRGFRVELGEIEAALCDLNGIGTAAVVLRRDDEMDQLVAFIVLDQEAKSQIQVKDIRAYLKARLPVYMIPNRFEIIEQVPRLLSGKIDRNALRKIELTTSVEKEISDEPQNEAEHILFGILQKLFPNQAIRLSADFFDDLGGHSLLAAVLTSELREYPEYAQITIQNIYQNRKVGAISQFMLAQTKQQQMREVGSYEINSLSRILCGTAQLFAIPVLIALTMLQWLAPFFSYHYFTGSPTDSIPNAIAISLGVYVASIIASFAISILGNRLLLSGIQAGQYPLWSRTYFRWWLADRLTNISPVYLLAGSSLNRLYLRALGAKIGQNVHVGSVFVRMPALLRIDHGVSVGSHVNLENAKVEQGHLVLGTIHLKQESYVGSYSVLEENTCLEDYAHLKALSALANGQTIPAHEIWDGTPAKYHSHINVETLLPRERVSRVRQTLEPLYYGVSGLVIACLFFIPIFPSFILVDWFDIKYFSDWESHHIVMTALHYFLLAIPASALMIVATALFAAFIRKLILPSLKAGTYSLHSMTYYRKWFATQILETSLQTLHGLFATVYAPAWFRLLGAKVGKDSEISTATGVVPELLTLGDESFIADAVMLGDEEITRGWMILQPTTVGRRSFVGNSAYIADGTNLPDGVLIGVQSKIPEKDQLQSGETWFGSPALRLPARETMADFPEHLTFKPSAARRLMRGFIESLRIVLPSAFAIGVGYMIVLSVIDTVVAKGWFYGLLALTLSGILYGVASFFLIVILKWAFIGRYKTRSAPMWTMFVWLSEGITSLYESIAIQNCLNYVRGTPFLPPLLRLLGVKVGKNVYLDTADITEFDCVSIGDYSELNSFSGPQTHLFEDRIMKIGEVKIGSHVTVHCRSIVLYNAEVADQTLLGPLTLVMKGEKIPTKSAWIGSPAQPWANG